MAQSWQTTGRMAALAATYALEENGTQNHSYSRQEFVTRYRRTFGESGEVESPAGRVAGVQAE